MLADLEKTQSILQQIPSEGLFAEKEWLISPEAFPVSPEFAEQLEKLGHRLNLFVQALNQLYPLSAQGRQPHWIADYLDRGKPAELIAISREKKLRNEIPLVIRPDIILTEDGFTIAELDSVPGGIGLTAWLNRTYSSLGEAVIGGASGMLEGFRAIMPGGDILVSEEAKTYRPEMEWLSAQLNQNYPDQSWNVRGTETPSPSAQNIYRFFELFDLPNIECAPSLMQGALENKYRVTPPFKPYMEEKMMFGLFWLRPLRDFWRRALGEKHWLELQKVIPYTWIVDPAPLPQHAVIPSLEINSWNELGDFSQKDRELILKISGFSELGWGSRGVHLGQDMPQAEWKTALQNAQESFQDHPYILQRFHKGKLIEHPYFDPATKTIKSLRGRVRLCPYYFLVEGKAQLKGVLATICPADKKLLHGMKDAIMVPTKIENVTPGTL